MTTTQNSLPDNIYYDMVVTNEIDTIVSPQIFSYTETRTTAFLYSPYLYEMSVVRFSADTTYAPVIIPLIRKGSGTSLPSRDLNDTAYSITLQYKKYVSGALDVNPTQIFIQWVAEDLTARVPSPPSQTPNQLQDNSTGYYNCYSFTYFINLVNIALTEAFNNLVILSAGDAEPITSFAPYMSWDSSSQCAVLYADNAWYNESTLTNPINIYMNASMFSLFSTFNFRIVQYAEPTITLGKNIQIICSNSGGINLFPVTNPTTQALLYNAIPMYQESSSVSAWSPITSLVWTSLQIPLIATQTSPTQIYINGQLITQTTQNNSSAQVITDLVTGDFQYRTNIVYAPTAEYRMISLVGTAPLYTIDIQVFYRLKDGSLLPFRLASGGSISALFLFRLKK